MKISAAFLAPPINSVTFLDETLCLAGNFYILDISVPSTYRFHLFLFGELWRRLLESTDWLASYIRWEQNNRTINLRDPQDPIALFTSAGSIWLVAVGYENE